MSVDSSSAQMRLARAMGYPPSWRVVRSLIQVPIPEYLAKQMKDSGAAVSTNEGGLHVMTTVRDRIYAGHPASQPDGYYNHAVVSHDDSILLRMYFSPPSEGLIGLN